MSKPSKLIGDDLAACFLKSSSVIQTSFCVSLMAASLVFTSWSFRYTSSSPLILVVSINQGINELFRSSIKIAVRPFRDVFFRGYAAKSYRLQAKSCD
jgi:hypothetical protein